MLFYMKGRNFILIAVVSLTLVASGCATDSSDPVEDNSSNTGGPEDVSDSEPENLEPNFEVVSLDISDEILMGGSAPLKLKVRNSATVQVTLPRMSSSPVRPWITMSTWTQEAISAVSLNPERRRRSHRR